MIFKETSGVTDSVFGKFQTPIRHILETQVQAFEQMSGAEKIFRQDKSSNFAESYNTMTDFGNFEAVTEGGSYPETSIQEGYNKILTPVEWKNSFKVTQTMIEDAKAMNINASGKKFIKSYGRTREMFAAALLAGAVSGKSTKFGAFDYDTTSADGVSMFNTEHKLKITGDKVSNKFTNAFSKDVFGEIETRMQNFRDEDGNLLNIAPDTIIIPNIHSLKDSVFEMVGADKDPDTNRNGFNYQFGRWNIIIWPYLNILVSDENPEPFILMDSTYNEDVGGAIMLNRIDLTVKSYIDENNDNNIFKGRARFTGGFNDWRAFAIGGVKGGTELAA